MALTDREIDAARLTLGRRIVQSIIDEPFMKTMLMLSTPSQRRQHGEQIIATVERILLGWTPTVISEGVLQMALEELEEQSRVEVLMVTGDITRQDAEQLASIQLLHR